MQRQTFRKLNIGILRKGFVVKSGNTEVTIPINTPVIFHNRNEEIICQGFDAKLFKVQGNWYCDYFGTILLVEFDKDKPPYPISYFEHLPKEKPI